MHGTSWGPERATLGWSCWELGKRVGKGQNPSKRLGKTPWHREQGGTGSAQPLRQPERASCKLETHRRAQVHPRMHSPMGPYPVTQQWPGWGKLRQGLTPPAGTEPAGGAPAFPPGSVTWDTPAPTAPSSPSQAEEQKEKILIKATKGKARLKSSAPAQGPSRLIRAFVCGCVQHVGKNRHQGELPWAGRALPREGENGEKKGKGMKGKHLPRFTDHVEEEGKTLPTWSTALQRVFLFSASAAVSHSPSSYTWPARCAGEEGGGGLGGGICTGRATRVGCFPSSGCFPAPASLPCSGTWPVMLPDGSGKRAAIPAWGFHVDVTVGVPMGTPTAPPP